MDFHKEFEKHEIKVCGMAREFRGLIQKLRNISASEARILKDISRMRKQLEEHLKDVTDFNTNIQSTSVKIVAELNKAERKVSQLNEEKFKYEKQQNDLSEELEQIKEKMKTIYKEKDAFTNKLKKVKEEREKLNNVQSILIWIPIIGWIDAALIEIYKSCEDYEGQISRLNEAVDKWNDKIVDFKIKMEYNEEIIRMNDFEIRICSQVKRDTMEQLEQLKEYQNQINQWLKALNEWLYFLINLEPQVERVERHIDNNENALHRAIGDLRDAITNNETKVLEEQAKKLAIVAKSDDSTFPAFFIKVATVYY